MARRFVRATPDYLNFSPGDLANLDGGPQTMIALWRPTNASDGSILYAENAGQFMSWSMFSVYDSHVWHQVQGSYRQGGPYTVGSWQISALTKAGGSAMVRAHTLVLGGSWEHTDTSECVDATTVPVALFRVGYNPFVGGLNGDIAALAVVGAAWTDGQIEGLATSLGSWVTLAGSTPGVILGFDQASASDPVVPVYGSSTQTDSSGPGVTEDDPPGWSYALSEPITGTADLALAPLTAPLVGVSLATGTSSTTLPALTGSADGSSLSAGTSALTLPALTAGAAGTSLVTGAGALTLPAPGASLAGLVFSATAPLPGFTTTVRLRSLSATVTT